MRQENDIFVGDIGTEIILDTLEDITDAISMSIEARRPDRTLVSWPATLEGTTAIKHVTVPTTLNMAGIWKLQAKVTIESGGSWRGETVNMLVKRDFG